MRWIKFTAELCNNIRLHYTHEQKIYIISNINIIFYTIIIINSSHTKRTLRMFVSFCCTTQLMNLSAYLIFLNDGNKFLSLVELFYLNHRECLNKNSYTYKSHHVNNSAIIGSALFKESDIFLFVFIFSIILSYNFFYSHPPITHTITI